MSTPDVESDIAAMIDEGGLATLGTDMFVGPERPTTTGVSPSIPFDCVFVQSFGGTRDDDNDKAIRGFRVQVLTRGARNAYAAAELKARQIHDLLDRKFNVTPTTTRYVSVMAMGAGPRYLGTDDSDAEFFAEDFEVVHGG